MIACKYEEIYQPETKDYLYITENTYSKSYLLEEEHNILSMLEFDFNSPSPNRFLECYLQLIGEDPIISMYAYFLLDL